MSRQYFADVLADPPLINPAPTSPITATTESAMWTPAQWTPLNIGDARAGKVYQLKAGGIWSTSSSASTLTLTPRLALTATTPLLGTSAAQVPPVSLSGVPWYMQFTLVVRTIGLTGANSTCVGNGFFAGASTAAAFVVPFGGTVASFDATAATGLWMGWTLSVAGSCTPEWMTWQSLN